MAEGGYCIAEQSHWKVSRNGNRSKRVGVWGMKDTTNMKQTDRENMRNVTVAWNMGYRDEKVSIYKCIWQCDDLTNIVYMPR